MDLVTKFGWAIPVKTRTASEIASALISRIFLVFGCCSYIISDRAAEFTSSEFQGILKELQIKQHLCTTYSPTSNSVCERLNRSLLQLIRVLLLEFSETWNELLPVAIAFYNSAFHVSIQNSPHYLMFLSDARIPYETILPDSPHEDQTLAARARDKAKCLELAKQAILATQDKRQELCKTGNKTKIDIGDLVFIKSATVNKRDHKILSKYWGPHRVIDMTAMSAVIKCLKSGRLRHVSLRNVKLLHHSSVSRTENGNVDAVFPTEDKNADMPDDVPHQEIKRHESLDTLEQNSNLHANPEVDAIDEGVVLAPSPTDKPLGESAASKVQAQMLKNEPKVKLRKVKEGKMPPANEQIQPVAARTRARMRNAMYCMAKLAELVTP